MSRVVGAGQRRFHHITQNRAQFKTSELFVFGIFHLNFQTAVDCTGTESSESEIADKGGPLY